MTRQKIAAGNWKMNKDLNDAVKMVRFLINQDRPKNILTVLGVPFPFLQTCIKETRGSADIIIAAQNCHHKENGAFTGEVSVTMLKSIGVSHVIVGHSERREYFFETDEMVGNKVRILLNHSMIPIFCCGEPLKVRKEGSHGSYVKHQVSKALYSLNEEEIAKVIIAYEPIWAIGTGETASPEQAQEMHHSIRTHLRDKYGKVSDEISILYGGSVNPGNAKELFRQADVDGGLIGGASLQEKGFLSILHSF